MYCRKCGKVVNDGEEYCDACKEAMKIVCPHCGKMTQPKKFCPYCGGNLTDKEDAKKVMQPEIPKKTCMACGSQIPKDAFYCPICRKISATSTTPTVSHRDEGSYFSGLLLGLFCGLLGLIIGISLEKSETKRGAIDGFWIQFAIGIVLVIVISYVARSAISEISSSTYY